MQINIGVAKLKDSGSMGSSKCLVCDNGKSTCRLNVNGAFKHFAVRKPIPYVF